MRNLSLTSPLSRGPDVTHLEQALNVRLKSRGQPVLKVDGIFGREVLDVVVQVGYELGINVDHGVTERVQKVIINPKLRNPTELIRANERKRHQAGVTKKIQAIIGTNLKGVEAAFAYARAHNGVHEAPAGSNWGYPFPANWETACGFSRGPWCGAFAKQLVVVAGGHPTNRMSFVPDIIADAQAGRNGFLLWHTDHSQARPGDLPCYNWVGGSEGQHVGFLEEILANGLHDWEGNTGGNNPSDGGMVAYEFRPFNVVLGYARPRYTV